MDLDAQARAIEAVQVKAPDAYGQSGFHGDAERWEALRRPCVAGVDKDGTYLDIGCANGVLLECAAKWSAQAGHRIEPFGLDHSQALAAMARTRLGVGADRIFVGDALKWEPPRRFDYVRTELVYVPGAQRRPYIERLASEFLAPQGRLIVASYGSRGGVPAAERVGDLLREWGFSVEGEAEAKDTLSDKTLTRVAWVAPRHRAPE